MKRDIRSRGIASGVRSPQAVSEPSPKNRATARYAALG